MDYLLWSIVGWAAFSLLAIPLFVRFGRCLARFDPPREQFAAAVAGAEVMTTAHTIPVSVQVLDRRTGGDRRDRRRAAGSASRRSGGYASRPPQTH